MIPSYIINHALEKRHMDFMVKAVYYVLFLLFNLSLTAAKNDQKPYRLFFSAQLADSNEKLIKAIKFEISNKPMILKMSKWIR